MQTATIPQNDFSKGSIPKTILRMALPMTAAQLVNVLYSMVDRIYISRMPGVGHLALTGLGLSLPIISIIMGLANLCGTGGAPRCAMARGAGDNAEAERYMGGSFTLLLCIGAVATVALWVCRRPLMMLFGASEATLPYADAYLSVYLWGTLFVMISLGMNPFITAQGFAAVAMRTTLIGAALNIVLDPLFIFAFNMGVSGAAWATVLSQGASAVWVLLFLTGKTAILKLRASRMRLSAKRAGQIVVLGFSGFIVNFTNSLVQTVCNVTLQAHGGDLYVGVMTAINSLREVSFMVVHGVSYAAQPVMSFNYGAKLYSRVRGTVRFTSSVVAGFSLLFWASVMLFPRWWAGIFSDDASLLNAAVPAARLYFLVYPLMSLQQAGQSVFIALGRAKQAIFFSLLRKAIVNAPLTVLLAGVMGVYGVFTAEAVSQFVGGIACFSVMLFTEYRPLGRLPDGQT